MHKNTKLLVEAAESLNLEMLDGHGDLLIEFGMGKEPRRMLKAYHHLLESGCTEEKLEAARGI